MSWMYLQEDVTAPSTGRQFYFGRNGYVKRFAHESTRGLPSSDHVSMWRVMSSNLHFVSRQLVLRASQCADSHVCRPISSAGGTSVLGRLPIVARSTTTGGNWEGQLLPGSVDATIPWVVSTFRFQRIVLLSMALPHHMLTPCQLVNARQRSRL
jgi:hypothetical protein